MEEVKLRKMRLHPLKTSPLHLSRKKKWKRIIREVAVESSGDKEEDYPSMKRKHDVVAMMEIEEVENVAKREILT